MRFKKSVTNSIFLVLQQIVVMALAFASRTVFARYMGMQYLGYTTLFGNIFIWFSFADMGFAAINFMLYKALAEEDRFKISSIVQMYRKGLRLAGIVILGFGFAITGVIPYLVHQQENLNIKELYAIYWIQLITTAIPYFSMHWRLYMQANQCGYICTSLDTIIHVFTSMGQILVLVQGTGIYAYLFVTLLGNIFSVFVLEYIGNKKYADVIIPGIQALSLKESGILKEIRDYIAQRISALVYNSTDSILISAFCGATVVGRYGNYTTIYQYTSALLFTKLFGGIQASLGNFLNQESPESAKRMFSILDTLMYLFTCVTCCGYIVCFQPFMNWWMGEENTLSDGFLLLYIFTAYISLDTELLYKYRSVYGYYKLDRGWSILSAVLNLGVSLLLVQKMGLIGIQIGTIVGLLCIVVGRLRVVFFMNPQFSLKTYLKKHFCRGVYFLIQAAITYFLCFRIPHSLSGLVLRGIIAVVVSGLAGIILMCVSKDARLLPKYLKTKIHLLHS